MTTTAPRTLRVRTLRSFDLERFWPSRRSHAFDEGCR
ncbi:hypothetical protein SAMN05216377_113165 [Pseudonocardia oroxyli]|uniref:Uncharacterized protein n=1 Tax=Pseudonocardia oroxyli TaxID=366584 RepID=A0A1G7VSJ1_PSEOR|nr:hypothetical protein SAMN05216377_113165 [Pseudonocardia oroxyli]